MNRSTGCKDKENGIRTNLTINPNFDNDVTGWVALNSVLSVVDSMLEIKNNDGVNFAKAFQDIVTVKGRLYKLNFSFKKGTAAIGRLVIGSASNESEIDEGTPLVATLLTAYETYFIAKESTTRITMINESITLDETAYFDTVKCENILDGFRDIFKNCRINFYGGTKAESADLGTNEPVVLQISKDGLGVDGLTWRDSINGVSSKNIDEIWSGKATIASLLKWFRVFEDGDNPSQNSTVNARIDGTIGVYNSDINMPTIYTIIDMEKILTNFSYKKED